MDSLAGAEAPTGASRRQHEVPGGEVHEPDVTAFGPDGPKARVGASPGPGRLAPRASVSEAASHWVAGGRPCEAMTESPSTSRTALQVASSSAHTRAASAPRTPWGVRSFRMIERGGVGLEPAVMAPPGHGPDVLQGHAVDLGHLAQEE